jgi:hypothetical protein
MNDIQQLLDRHAIHEVLMRYARGIDRCDFELVEQCYHRGATDDHGRFKGTIEDFIPWVKVQLDRFDSTMHFLGNVLIELDGDAAAAETYCIAYHRLKGEDVDSIAGLRYVDRFDKRSGEWRIAHRDIVVEWNRVDPVAAPGFGPEYLRGHRDRSDPVYR